MRVMWIPGVCACTLAVVLTAGCSVRHPSFMPETDLAQAHADSVSLDTFLTMPEAEQAERIERAEDALTPLNVVEAAESAFKHYLSSPMVSIPYRVYRTMPPLGDVIDHLDAALGLNPTRGDLWLVRGRLLDIAGDHRRARESLEMAWLVVDRVPEQEHDPADLRRNIAVASAWLERDAGWWDSGLSWLDRASRDIHADDSEAHLLRGLLLAGRGDLEDAMALSYSLPPVTVPVVGQMGLEGFLGLKKQKTDMLKRWLQAEVWMRRGRSDLAWAVLGEIPYWRRIMVIPHRFYQDLGLYAEVDNDVYRANLYYALAYVRREYRRATAPLPLTTADVINGLPDSRLNFYRMRTGAYHGGSLAAYAFSTAMLAMENEGTPRGEQQYLLATEALETCMRRGILRDEAVALRGQLRFSRGHYVLAEIDLSEARRAFAANGGVEFWTSYLLGLIAMGRDAHREAVSLLEECLTADDTEAGAWDALGVARLQLGMRRQAMLAFDQAVAADPRSHSARFNRGLLRSQEGDLDGGLEDFTAAAALSPDNMQIARVIQLANLAKREGRAFMPGLDQVGRWQPAAMDVQAHEGGAFSPEALSGRAAWQARIAALFDEVVSETGSQVRADGLDAAELVRLVQAYDQEPSAENRKVLAHAFVWLDLPGEARDLLAPHWGGDLDPDEVVLLLWLDQRAGEEARLRELVRSMGEEVALEVDRYGWAALASVIIGDHRAAVTGKQTTFGRYDVEQRGTSYGGRFNVWMSRQRFRMAHGIGDEDGNMLVDPRGRSYAFNRGASLTGRGRGETGGAGNPKVRSLTAGKR